MAAPGNDDLMAFLAEVNEAKPPVEGEETAGGGGEGGSPGIGAGKRPREAEDGAAAAGGEQQPAVLQAPVVLKKAKMVVAKAKPQIFSPQDQEAAAAAAAAAAANITAGLANLPGGSGPAPPGMASPGGMMVIGGDPGAAAAAGGGYPTGPPHMGIGMGMGMGMGMPPPPPGLPPQPGAGGGPVASAQQHSSGFVTGEAAAAMAGKKPKKFVRVGANKEETYEDPTLNEWPDNDFRLFCGDLGNDVTDEVLANAFRHKYPSFAKAKVVRDKYKGKSKGYGFVSFLDPFEGLKALREMNLKYIGSRPVKLRKSDWKDRNLKEVKKKEKQKTQFLQKLGIS